MAFEHVSIYPPLWLSRHTGDAYETAIHYHAGTAWDGYSNTGQGWSLAVGSTFTHQGQINFPNLPRDPQIPFNVSMITGSIWGRVGTLLRKPRAIRVIHACGWNSQEMYPLKVLSNVQSPYLPTVSTGQNENFVDYSTDLVSPLTDFCSTNNVDAFTMGTDFIGPFQIGPIAPGGGPVGDRTFDQETISGFDDLVWYPMGFQSRWLFNLAPRFAVAGVNGNLATQTNNWASPPQAQGKLPSLFIPVDNVVGGEVLNIVFVSDAYSSYHGVSSSTFVTVTGSGDFVDKSGAGNTAMYEEDLQRIIDTIPKFKSWGLIIVNGLKNPIGFPLWTESTNFPTNFTRAYSFYDAQIHFQDVEQRLKAAGAQVKLLMRDVELISPINSFEKHSLGFAKPRIEITDIMDSVEQFWSSGTL